MTNKVYDLITERILTQLDNGVVPWRKPWGLQPGLMPMNGTTSREYRGINALMLGLSGYGDIRWMTYKQAAERGAQVKKSEQSTPIIFWKQTQVEDDDGKTKTIPMLRYYAVFNVEQIDGLKLPKLAVQENTFNAIEEAEAVVANMPQRPSIDHDGRSQAYYNPPADSIHLPPQSTFESPDEYYSTLFHELGHSTGHESRLNRHGMETGIAPFGSATYSKEELAAEFTACFLCHLSGITNTTDDSAAYIAGWASKLRSDRMLVLQGASQGQKPLISSWGVARPRSSPRGRSGPWRISWRTCTREVRSHDDDRTAQAAHPDQCFDQHQRRPYLRGDGGDSGRHSGGSPGRVRPAGRGA